MPQFGVYLPNVGWDELPTPAELADYAVAAEELGLHSLWVEDRLLHSRVGILEALTTLIFVTSRTSRIKLGTSVLLPNLRNPLTLAKTLSTLDYLSNGRVIIGASLGGRPDEYETSGIPMRTRVTRFLDTLRVTRALWGQGESDPPSAMFPASNLSMEPRPVQQRLPIWIGGRAEPVYRRVATIGDGWLASSTGDPAEFARGWGRVLEEAAAIGRPPQELMPAKFCYIHVDDNPDTAMAVLEARIPRYYTFPYDVAAHALYGPPSQCAQRAQTFLDAGVETLIFSAVTRDRTQLERLCREVLPLLH